MAFAKAIEARADMIELDCQLSRDGHVVVFHDEHLRRTAGSRGSVWNKDLDQLKKLDIGRWRKKSFSGERILTLEEALEILAGKIELCLEIKNYPKSLPGIELKVLFILSHYDQLDRTIVSSFDHRSLARVRELAPEARLGLICASPVKQDPFELASRLTATSLHVEKNLATREFLTRAWDEGLDVYVWTVNELREMETFISMGVQGVFSDFPERFSKLKTH